MTADLIKHDRLVCPREVLEELNKKDDDYHKCTKLAGLVVEPEDECTSLVKKITDAFPGWVSEKTNRADPWIIAEAESRGFTVVTEERRSRSPRLERVKIPNVCKKRGVKCTNFVGMIEAEGWSF